MKTAAGATGKVADLKTGARVPVAWSRHDGKSLATEISQL